MSLNKATLIGSLGRDPEIKSFSNGNRVCNLSLATSESWKDKTSGERQTKTEWHRISIFTEGLIKICESYLKKGSKIYIEGAIRTRKYDKNGVDTYATEIVLQGFTGKLVMLDGKSAGGGDGRNDGEGDASSQGSGGSGGQTGGTDGGAGLEDDEIPF